MNRSLFSKLLNRQSPVRSRKSVRLSWRPEQLEVRTLLTADVLAQIVGGNFYLTGVDAGSREITVTRDTDNPLLIDITPGANTTINGSATTIKVPGSFVTGGVSIYLNSGAGTGNTTRLSVDVPQLFLPGSAYISLVGNGNDTLNIDHGEILGSMYISTGGGDDRITIENAEVHGITSISTGIGSDWVGLSDNTLSTTFVTASGNQNSIFVSKSSQGTTYLYAAGDSYIAVSDDITINGNLFLTLPSGQHLAGIFDATIDGILVINLGSGPNSEAALQEVTAKSTTIVSASDTSFIGVVDSHFTGALTIIALGSDNNLVGVVGSTTVTGATTIITGTGDDFIGVGGLTTMEDGEFEDEESDEIATTNIHSLTILTGTGKTFVAMANLNATSLTLIANGTSTVGIGTDIDIPDDVLPDGIEIGDDDGLLLGGPVNFSGPVLVQSLGGSNNTQIQQATFGGAFTLYDLKGSNTLEINDSTFNGFTIIDMGGSNNVINVERNNDLTGSTFFNAITIFDYFNATTKGGGGFINIGFSGAPTPTAKFNADAYFIGAHLRTWPGAGFSKNPILILSDRIQLP